MTDAFAIYPSLKDRVVFLTGGASGIGAEEVTQFARQGAKVAFVDIDDGAAASLVDALKAAGHPAPFYQHCDLHDIAALRASIAEAAKRLEDLTRSHVGWHIAVVVNDKILSAPTVRSVITDGNARVTPCEDKSCETLLRQLSK